MTMQIRRAMIGGAANAPLSGTPVARPHSLYRAYGKRALDILAVCLLALPALLIILPAALLIARDGAPPFYRQERLGQNGRHFWIWKLRTMVNDAEARLDACLAADPDAQAEWETTQKLRHDPRITPIGRILRKTSMDELPQLLNVMRGKMSLVGPRPMMVSQKALYPGDAYFRMRPGITGPWQISARNETSFAARAHFDTDYDRDLSLWTDISILLRTVKVVLRGTGY